MSVARAAAASLPRRIFYRQIAKANGEYKSQHRITVFCQGGGTYTGVETALILEPVGDQKKGV